MKVDLRRIAANLKKTMHLCKSVGVEPMGVTKGVCGDPRIARLFLDAGFSSLGEARLDSLAMLRSARVESPRWLIRSPAIDEVDRCVELADGSLASHEATLRALGGAATARRVEHQIMLMLDLETGREGLSPDRLDDTIRFVERAEGLSLAGVGVYFDRTSGAKDRRHAFETLHSISQRYRERIPWVSGGASNVLAQCLEEGEAPAGVNHLRVGTAPLLGIATSHRPTTIADWDRDTFLLEAPVLEAKSEDQCLVALGYLDTAPEFLYPVNPALRVGRASSDLLVLHGPVPTTVGELVTFRLGYPALSRLMASPFTRKEYVEG